MKISNAIAVAAAVTCLALAGAMAALAQEARPSDALVIIVNNANPVDNLPAGELEKIYLGKRGFWEWGKPIKMADLIEENLHEDKSTRAVFSVQYLDKSLASLKSYWIRAIFAGRGQPPLVFGKSRDVINYVSENVGAIGYIRKKDFVPGKVKSLDILNGDGA